MRPIWLSSHPLATTLPGPPSHGWRDMTRRYVSAMLQSQGWPQRHPPPVDPRTKTSVWPMCSSAMPGRTTTTYPVS